MICCQIFLHKNYVRSNLMQLLFLCQNDRLSVVSHKYLFMPLASIILRIEAIGAICLDSVNKGVHFRKKILKQ